MFVVFLFFAKMDKNCLALFDDLFPFIITYYNYSKAHYMLYAYDKKHTIKWKSNIAKLKEKIYFRYNWNVYNVTKIKKKKEIV